MQEPEARERGATYDSDLLPGWDAPWGLRVRFELRARSRRLRGLMRARGRRVWERTVRGVAASASVWSVGIMVCCVVGAGASGVASWVEMARTDQRIIPVQASVRVIGELDVGSPELVAVPGPAGVEYVADGASRPPSAPGGGGGGVIPGGREGGLPRVQRLEYRFEDPSGQVHRLEEAGSFPGGSTRISVDSRSWERSRDAYDGRTRAALAAGVAGITGLLGLGVCGASRRLQARVALRARRLAAAAALREELHERALQHEHNLAETRRLRALVGRGSPPPEVLETLEALWGELVTCGERECRLELWVAFSRWDLRRYEFSQLASEAVRATCTLGVVGAVSAGVAEASQEPELG